MKKLLYYVANNRPIRMEIISPRRFARFTKAELENVEAAEVQPFALGSGKIGGRILVKYKQPVLRGGLRKAAFE